MSNIQYRSILILDNFFLRYSVLDIQYSFKFKRSFEGEIKIEELKGFYFFGFEGWEVLKSQSYKVLKLEGEKGLKGYHVTMCVGLKP